MTAIDRLSFMRRLQHRARPDRGPRTSRPPWVGGVIALGLVAASLALLLSNRPTPPNVVLITGTTGIAGMPADGI